MDDLSALLADIIDYPERYDEPRAYLSSCRSLLPETASARAAREKREGADRSRRYRERRTERDAYREQVLVAREAEVARREAKIALTEHDSLIVDVLRGLIRDPALLAAIRTPAGMQGATIRLHDILHQAVLALTSDVGLPRKEAAQTLNKRLFKRDATTA